MAIQFNQASDRVYRSDTFPNPLVTGISFSGYYFLVSDLNRNATYHRISNNNVTTATLATDVGGLGLNYFTSGGAITSSVNNGVGQWMAFGYTLQGTNCIIYARLLGNNTVVNSGTVSQDTPSHFCLGGRHQIDDTEWGHIRTAYNRFWSGILTQAEFEAEWDSIEAVRSADLWADWPLVDDLSDISGNDRPLTAGTTQFSIEDGPPIVTIPDLVKTRLFLWYPQNDYSFVLDSLDRNKAFFLLPDYDFTPTFIPNSLVTALASYLQDNGYGIYKPNENFSNDEIAIVIDSYIDEPNKLIVVTQYAGSESNSWDDWDEPRVQIKVRGTADPSFSYDTCQAIYKEFHGLGPITLSGIDIQLIVGLNSGASYIGKDDTGRQRHVTNFRVTVGRE
jgi:Bacteriophage minor capsid protein